MASKRNPVAFVTRRLEWHRIGTRYLPARATLIASDNRAKLKQVAQHVLAAGLKHHAKAATIVLDLSTPAAPRELYRAASSGRSMC